MRSLRVLSFFLLVMGVGVVAEAQCLRCFRQPGLPPTQGTCGETLEGSCDRQCCGNSVGAPCRRPDALDPCGWVASKSPQTPTVLRAQRPMPYFGTRQPLERNTESTYREIKQKVGCDSRA